MLVQFGVGDNQTVFTQGQRMQMKFLCLCIALGICLTLSMAKPRHKPLRQYPSQIKAVANLTAIAVRKSKVRSQFSQWTNALIATAHATLVADDYCPPYQERTQEAYDILSTRDIRAALNKSCPQWSHFSSKELLQVRFCQACCQA